MFDKLKQDLKHYEDAGRLPHLGFWVGALYRLGNWSEKQPLPVRMGAGTMHKVLSVPIKFFRNVHIPPKTEIGPGLCMHHPGNIIVSSRTRIGENCTIYQEVTLGGGGAVPGLPVIGDNVSIYAGAKILGGVRIGNNVQVGANAVVSSDVPEGAIVPSPPCRPISKAMVEKMQAARAKTAQGS